MYVYKCIHLYTYIVAPANVYMLAPVYMLVICIQPANMYTWRMYTFVYIHISACKCINMYVYKCIHVYVFIGSVCVSYEAHTLPHVDIQMYTYVFIQMYIRVCIHTYVYKCIYVYVAPASTKYVCIQMKYVCIQMYTCLFTYM